MAQRLYQSKGLPGGLGPEPAGTQYSAAAVHLRSTVRADTTTVAPTVCAIRSRAERSATRSGHGVGVFAASKGRSVGPDRGGKALACSLETCYIMSNLILELFHALPERRRTSCSVPVMCLSKVLLP